MASAAAGDAPEAGARRIDSAEKARVKEENLARVRCRSKKRTVRRSEPFEEAAEASTVTPRCLR